MPVRWRVGTYRDESSRDIYQIWSVCEGEISSSYKTSEAPTPLSHWSQLNNESNFFVVFYAISSILND